MDLIELIKETALNLDFYYKEEGLDYWDFEDCLTDQVMNALEDEGMEMDRDELNDLVIELVMNNLCSE